VVSYLEIEIGTAFLEQILLVFPLSILLAQKLLHLILLSL